MDVHPSHQREVLRRVTRLAIRPQLSAVNIQVAAGAVVWCQVWSIEAQVEVTAPTVRLLVPSRQREDGLSVVAELHILAERTPSRRRVACLARDGDLTVRVVATCRACDSADKGKPQDGDTRLGRETRRAR